MWLLGATLPCHDRAGCGIAADPRRTQQRFRGVRALRRALASLASLTASQHGPGDVLARPHGLPPLLVLGVRVAGTVSVALRLPGGLLDELHLREPAVCAPPFFQLV